MHLPQNEQFLMSFKNEPEVPITLEEMDRTYCQLMKLEYPLTEMLFIRSWMLFRVSPRKTHF